VTTAVDPRQRILQATVQLLGTRNPELLRAVDVAAAAEADEATINALFDTWESLLAAAEGERFLGQQAKALAAFAHDVRTCRSRRDFAAVIERHLSAAFTPARAPVRAARMRVLGQCCDKAVLAASVAQAHRIATTLVGDAFRVAQTRGWISAGVDPEVLAAWTLGQVTSRFLMEFDTTRSAEQLAQWDRIAIDAVLQATGNLRPTATRATSRWRRSRVTS
jgi:hypothetical protein